MEHVKFETKRAAKILDVVGDKFKDVLGASWDAQITKNKDGTLSSRMHIWNGKDSFRLDCNDDRCELSKITYVKQQGFAAGFLWGCAQQIPAPWEFSEYVGAADIKINGGNLQDIKSGDGAATAGDASGDICKEPEGMCLKDAKSNSDAVDKMPNAAEIISISFDGSPLNNVSRRPVLSYDGRYVAYESEASNITIGDTNNYTDIFIYDRENGKSELVSIGVNGQPSNGNSRSPSISDDGQKIVFYSEATNLIEPNTNGAGTYLFNRNTKKIKLIAEDIYSATISGDGNYVVFNTKRTDLVTGDLNNFSDVFLYDCENEQYKMVSVNINGVAGNYGSGWVGAVNDVSFSGTLVGFISFATNLCGVDTNITNITNIFKVFVKNIKSGEVELISICNGKKNTGESLLVDMSYDGRFVLFNSECNIVSDNNNKRDLFLHDRQLGITELVSLDEQNNQLPNGTHINANGCVNSNGRFVAFESYDETEGVKLLVRDLQNKKTKQLIGTYNIHPAFSGDGKWFTFAKIYKEEDEQLSLIIVIGLEKVFDLN